MSTAFVVLMLLAVLIGSVAQRLSLQYLAGTMLAAAVALALLALQVSR